jgi:aminoglycoside/choline kinase family phosphotransferase
MNLQLSENLLVKTLIEEYLDKKRFPTPIIEITRLTGDASTRRYYRLMFEDRFTAIACMDKPISDHTEIEFVAVTRFLKSKGVAVPEIYISIPAKGFILEEDLGDRTMLIELSEIQTQATVDSIYEKVADEMIKIHRIKVTETPSEFFFNRYFDHEKLMYEVNLSIENFLIHLCGVAKNSVVLEVIKNEFSEICFWLAEKNRWVPTHRDYHSRNIMFKNSCPKVIDYQDMRLGLPTYDLVSLLEDAYFRIDEPLRQKIKERYFTEMKGLYQSNKSEFEQEYDLMAIQRIFKAIGSFSYIWKERKDHRYLKYISKCFERLSFLLQKNGKNRLSLQLNKIFYES